MHPEFNIRREQHNQLQFGRTKNPGVRFHFHSQIELHLVEEGEMEVWINDRRSILKPGDVSVALSYDAHRYYTPRECTARYLIIPTYMCGEFLSSVNSKRAGNPFIRDRKTFETIRDCCDALQKDRTNHVKTLGYIYVILGTLMDQMDLQERPETVDPQLSTRILFYINENFKSDLSLRSIAAALGYNPGYLSRYFKECFNVGISQYITVIRLREAVLLMKEGKRDVTYCAFESGFNSIRTFYRVFYNEFHCTPKEYLNQIRAQ